MTVRLLALSFLLLSTSATSVHAAGLPDGKAQKAAVKCQKAIDQVGAKLVATKLKSLDACATAVLACIQVKPGDAACLAKATAKCTKSLIDAIPQAQVGAVAKIVKSCGTPLRIADLLAADGLGIGAQAAPCNTDFGLNVCSDVPTLAQCLVATQGRTAERVFAAEQPRARELIQQVVSPVPLPDLPGFSGCDDCSVAPSATLGKAVAACGATLTKTGRAFAGAVQKGLGSCIGKVFACLQTKPGDAKCLAKAADGCDATVSKLAAARGKLAAGIDKRCADGALLPFATLAAAAALNLDGLAVDCADLGGGPLASLDDYVTCVRRQHECRVADLLRRTLPRTSELVDGGLLGNAGDLLDPAACPAALPSDQFLTVKRTARFVGTFSTSRFLAIVKKIGGGGGVKATTVTAPAPFSSSNAQRRISFPQGAPSRFLPGSSRIVKVSFTKPKTRAKPNSEKNARLVPGQATMLIAVQRADIAVEDHLAIPLDGDEGEVELEIQYDAAPPSCVFDLAFAVDEDGEVSDYAVVEQVSDTVPPPTATPEPVPTATPSVTPIPTTTVTVTPSATATGGGTPTLTPTATGATPTPSPTATSNAVFAYALTTNDDTAAPGATASLTLTITNLTAAPQNAALSFTVPNFTTFVGFSAGAVRPLAFGTVAPGASESAIIPLVVTSGAQAPPDGTNISLTCSDGARGASVTRSFVTDATPAATLELATADGTVAPGGAFTYALAFHNASNGTLAGAEASVRVPDGATFVAAEDGVVPGLDGIVRWPLGALAANAAGRRTVTFAATGGTAAALVVAAELRDGAAQALAHASATTAVHASPVFAYTLTSNDDAAAPGRYALYTLTVTNLTNAGQDASILFRVPDFTSYAGFGAGNVRTIAFGTVAAGATESALLPLLVTSGSAAPPDGSVIGLGLQDTARGVAVSRTVVTQSAPIAELAVNATVGTVAPAGTTTYTLAFDDPKGAPLADVELGVRVPAGATFVTASEGVAPDADGIVRWQLGTLAGNASGERTVTFAALDDARRPLLVEADLRTATTGEVVTQGSAATPTYAAPVFAYALTTTDDAVTPGGTALFRLTVTNLSNAAQDATLAFRVPDYTTYAGFGAGSVRPIAFGAVPAGTAESALIPLVVTNGAAAPPDGTLIALATHDTARGASVARAVVVRATPVAELTLATAESTVAPGQPFTYTFAFHNPRAGALSALELGVRVPAGATFVAADEGVVPDADGIVSLPIGTLAGNASGQRRVTFQANAGAAAALLVEADLHDGSTHEVITHASAATAVAATPPFTYALTVTDDDPIVPGRTATFLLTATNHGNAPLSTTLQFRVPDFTTYAGFGAGSVRPVTFSNVAAGASQSAIIPVTLTSGAAAPPDGTVIRLACDDGAHGAGVSRTIVARAAGRAELKLATTSGTVAPGAAFTYALAFHNQQASALVGAELAVRVPTGASFVSAEGGVVPDADGVVRFPIASLAAGAADDRTVTFAAGATTTAPLVVAATLRDAGDEILAEASATMPVYATPTFAYELTRALDTVAPGQTASFVIRVTNLTNAAQSATLAFRVPDFTSYGGFGPGNVRSVTLSNVTAGAAQETTINLLVASGAGAPPTGTLIDLTTTDGGRGASVSRTIVVGP